MSEKGHGRIRVSAELWPHIGSPETPEAWHKALFLPETIEIERVERCDYATPGRSLFDLYMVSESIPPSETLIEVSVIHRGAIEPIGERIHEH